MGTKPDPQLIPLAEAAGRLQMGYQRAWNEALRGHLGPVIRKGVRIFLTEAGVRAYGAAPARGASVAA